MLLPPAMEEDIFADAPPPDADERVRRLYQYWLEIHPPGAGLPGRQHLDPTALPPALLPFLWLADVQREPLRFRYRLLGTEQVGVLGRDYTGQWIDEVHPAFLGSAPSGQFIAAAEHGRPGYRRGSTLIILPKDYLSMERLIMPLARDGRTVDMLLAISVYHKVPRQP
jgi:PAS domain